MKFSKFVKSLAPDGGAIYEYMDERWLASPSVLMLIPDGIRSVTGYSNEKMPDGIGRLISQVGCTEYATLVKAIMPEPDGAIKDCVRIFATPDSTMTLPITNDDWSLTRSLTSAKSCMLTIWKATRAYRKPCWSSSTPSTPMTKTSWLVSSSPASTQNSSIFTP